MFWVYLMACFALVMFAGLMSGLTLGLMSLSLVDLEVLAKAGTPKDKLNAGIVAIHTVSFPGSVVLLINSSVARTHHAERILPVVKNQHLLLCTLLIGNSLAMEALPIFLDKLVPSFVAILISVTLILAFGEVTPFCYFPSIQSNSIVIRSPRPFCTLPDELFPADHPASRLHALRPQRGGQGRPRGPGSSHPLLPRRIPHQQGTRARAGRFVPSPLHELGTDYWSLVLGGCPMPCPTEIGMGHHR